MVTSRASNTKFMCICTLSHVLSVAAEGPAHMCQGRGSQHKVQYSAHIGNKSILGKTINQL